MRRTAVDDETTPSHQPISTAQQPISTQEILQEPIADDDQVLEESSGDYSDPRHIARVCSHVRSIFRSVAHPVAIVTALAPESAGDSIGVSDGSFGGTQVGNEWEDALKPMRAMTISSLNTVSLDPTPVISFNVRVPSSTWDAIRVRRHFRVALLRATERGSEIAKLFSKGDAMEGYRLLLVGGSSVTLHKPGSLIRVTESAVQHKVNAKNIDPNPAPFIKSRAFTCYFDAELRPEQCVQVNDHIIVVADVRFVIKGTTALSRGNDKLFPALSYFNHQFVRPDRPLAASSITDEERLGSESRISEPPNGTTSIRKVRIGNSKGVKDKPSSEQNSAMDSSTFNGAQDVKEQHLLENLRIRRVSG